MALRRYLNVARAIDNPQIKSAYEKLLDALPARLDAYAKAPTPVEAQVIGEAIGWLEDFQQADALVAAVRKRFCRPNLFLQVSRDLIAAGLAEPVEETGPVRDVILGTRIYGTGHTTGHLDIQFSPNQEDAAIDTVLTTETHSDNIGYNGPVRVYSRGVTNIDARKRFLINDQGITAMPAASLATTSSTIDQICAVRGGQLVEGFAWKRACRDKQRAEAIGSCHAEDRVNRRIDQQADEMLVRANDKFQEKFRQPLFERKLLPRPLRFSTTTDALRIMGLEAGPAQLASSTAPPKLSEASDVAVRVHESMINNAAATMLAGRTVSEEEFLQAIGDILGKVPERLSARGRQRAVGDQLPVPRTLQRRVCRRRVPHLAKCDWLHARRQRLPGHEHHRDLQDRAKRQGLPRDPARQARSLPARLRHPKASPLGPRTDPPSFVTGPIRQGLRGTLDRPRHARTTRQVGKGRQAPTLSLEHRRRLDAHGLAAAGRGEVDGDQPGFSLAPKGAQYISPGQRPGEQWLENRQALKGRNISCFNQCQR